MIFSSVNDGLCSVTDRLADGSTGPQRRGPSLRPAQVQVDEVVGDGAERSGGGVQAVMRGVGGRCDAEDGGDLVNLGPAAILIGAVGEYQQIPAVLVHRNRWIMVEVVGEF